MEKRILGRTGMEVARLGYGAIKLPVREMLAEAKRALG